MAVSSSVSHLPNRFKRRIAGPPIRSSGYELDLDMQFFLRLADLGPQPSLSTKTPAEARKSLRKATRAAGGRPVELAKVHGLTIAGATGPLRARLYEPFETKGDDASALLIYFHGGGWVAGDIDTHDPLCRILARASGARVLSVDYRLSPEHPFPAPCDDALASFRDAVARADELRIDPKRIAVGGDSSGGHLAAIIALDAAADGGPAPALQLLIYPPTDCVEASASRNEFVEGFVLTKQNMEWYEQQFLGGSGDRNDPRVSPLRAPDLAGVAPALVVTSGFDILRDEDEAYAARLKEAGVRTILRRYSGFAHGFVNMLGLWTGPREAVAEIGGILRAELAA